MLRGLVVPGYGWRHHPAVRMWRGWEEALVRYGLDVCAEWCRRGHADSCAGTLQRDLQAAAGITVVRPQHELAAAGALPGWLGDEALHRSHQSALVRKDPAWYRAVFPDVASDLPYVWPEPGATPPRISPRAG